MKSGLTSDWEDFKAVQKEVNKQVRGVKRSHLQETKSTDNQRQFGRFINSSRKDNGVQVLKGALDNFNIIPTFFSKKIEISISSEAYACKMTTC